MNKTKEILWEKLDNIPVIDTHEHVPGSVQKREQQHDVFCEYLPGYLSRDLMSAGLPPKDLVFLLEPGHTVMEKWNLVAKYWMYCRHTGYAQVFDYTVRNLYGLDGINGKTIEALNDAVQKTYDTNHFETVFHKKCHIKVSLVDNRDPDSDRDFFRYMYRPDFMICPIKEDDILKLESYLGRPVSCLDDWLEGCTIVLRNAMTSGAAGFKTQLAYLRSLYFDRPSYSEAQNAFTEMIRTASRIAKGFPTSELTRPVLAGRAFSDYVMHHVLREIQRLGSVLQIHTGYLEGYGGRLADTDPVLLNDLFIEYPGIRFDVFHMGFPYQEKTIALCKAFPNVYLNFCWTHILAPESARTALKESLTMLPLNKISIFGGDHSTAIDAVYGHLLMAKENVTNVFAEFVENDFMDIDEALWIINRIFYDNPVDLYSLKFDS